MSKGADNESTTGLRDKGNGFMLRPCEQLKGLQVNFH